MNVRPIPPEKLQDVKAFLKLAFGEPQETPPCFAAVLRKIK